MSKEKRGTWSSSLSLIIACVGSAVGLGNLWKFPYITYQNGGGAFVIVYLIAIAAVGFPLMLSELLLGRSTSKGLFGAFAKVTKNSTFWKALGFIGVLASFLIMTFYSVVGGWTLDYVFNALTGELSGLTDENAGAYFNEFVSNGPRQVLLHTIVMIITATIVINGTAGIEKVLYVLMPFLFIFIISIVLVSTSQYGASETFNFMFSFDFSTLTGHAALEALGHAFFSLSLAMGVMVVYGSYLPKGSSVLSSAIWIVCLDTLIAILACFMMYPIIFGTNLDTEAEAILFTSLTVQFNQMPAGQLITIVFYLLVSFAAVSSTISMFEVVTSYVNETFKFGRVKSTIYTALSIWFIGIGCALSNSDVKIFKSLDMFNNLDYVTSNWFLPLGGFFLSLLVGWKVKDSVKKNEFNMKSKDQTILFSLFNISLRYISPVAIFIVILYQLGVF